jgi:four helix bundle protein
VASPVLDQQHGCCALTRGPDRLAMCTRTEIGVYALLKRLPRPRDPEYCDQLRRSARSAPRLIAEGFGRYLPADFSKYLRYANGELKETYDALRDGVDSGYFTNDDILPLERLSKRASKASTNLVAYLASAKPPNEPREPKKRAGSKNPKERKDRRSARTRRNPRNPPNPRTGLPEPPAPPEPPEPVVGAPCTTPSCSIASSS